MNMTEINETEFNASVIKKTEFEILNSETTEKNIKSLLINKAQFKALNVTAGVLDTNIEIFVGKYTELSAKIEKRNSFDFDEMKPADLTIKSSRLYNKLVRIFNDNQKAYGWRIQIMFEFLIMMYNKRHGTEYIDDEFNPILDQLIANQGE